MILLVQGCYVHAAHKTMLLREAEKAEELILNILEYGDQRQTPADRVSLIPVLEDCLEMLGRLSGRAHRVLTGVALTDRHGTATALSDTDVYFREISRDEALAYWQSGEPRDKAGAYAIQGLGGAFVERIEGSYTGVVGLPVFETIELLRAAGIDVLAKR